MYVHYRSNFLIVVFNAHYLFDKCIQISNIVKYAYS